jgi:hypothetical protein
MYDSSAEEKQKFSIRIPAGITIFLFLSACTQQQAIDSTGAAMKNMCKTARSCTVNAPDAAAR